MIYNIKGKYTEGPAKVEFDRYGNGRVAIRLLNPDTDEPIATATVNVVEYDLPDGHVLLKGWSENEGIPEAMQKAGIVKLTGVKVPCGFVEAEVAVLNNEMCAE